MLYTIKNACIEEPNLVYNDGVCILNFNTTGTVGGIAELQPFLTYLEDSRKANAVKIVADAVAEKDAEIERLKAIIETHDSKNKV